MQVALGWKAHSGWAALVAIGGRRGDVRLVDRRRVELVDDDGREHARQPYHAAEGRPAAEARAIVERGIAGARAGALREMRAAIARTADGGGDVTACAVLVGAPMPAWSVDEILAVHLRMHQAEGVLYRDVLVRAAGACGLAPVTIPEKELADVAQAALAQPRAAVVKTVAALGKAAGPPWGKDQKDAALAALIALAGRKGRS